MRVCVIVLCDVTVIDVYDAFGGLGGDCVL